MSVARQSVFEKIYSEHAWGGNSRSGPGSDPEQTAPYVRFVTSWLLAHPDCRTIVEFGCGDWATTSLIALGDTRDYLGLDIVGSVIEENRKRFAGARRRFEQCDFIASREHTGDILLVKDVLQHLSNEAVQVFVKEILPKFRFALITNDIRKFVEERRFGIIKSRRDIQQVNSDIKDGASRPLRMDLPPFGLSASERFSFSLVMDKGPPKITYIKEIFVWQNLMRTA